MVIHYEEEFVPEMMAGGAALVATAKERDVRPPERTRRFQTPSVLCLVVSFR